MATLLCDKYVKTRIEHQCNGCLRIIPEGAQARFQSGVDDGFYSLYLCETCNKVLDEWDGSMLLDGFDEGELKKDPRWEIIREQIEGDANG